MVVVVSFEEKTPDRDGKSTLVRQRFETGVFRNLVVVQHALKDEEMAGACSNKNKGAREGYKFVTNFHADFREGTYTLTTCDSDSIFFSK